MRPFTTTAAAFAPTPSPVIVIAGADTYPSPGLITLIEDMPENDCGISSNWTTRSTPEASATVKKVDVNLLPTL